MEGKIINNNNLFDVIPAKFYKPLTGKNRNFYSQFLLRLHNELISTAEFAFSKTYILEMIDEVIRNYNDELVIDEDEGVELYGGTTVTKEYAYYVLRNDGWLQEEDSENGKEKYVSVPHYASIQLNAMNSMANPVKIYLGNYSRIIINNLRDIAANKLQKPYQDGFDPMLEAYRGIRDELRRVTAMLKESAEKALQQNSDEALENLKQYYTESIDGGKLQVLLVNEGLTPQYLREVKKLLIQIRDDPKIFEALCNGAAEHNGTEKQDAENYIDQSISLIITLLCDNYDETVEHIHAQAAKYIRTVSDKISTIIDSKGGVMNGIKTVIREITELDDEAFERFSNSTTPSVNRITSLNSIMPIESASLYKPKNYGDLGEEESYIQNTAFVPDVAEMARLTTISKCHTRYSNDMAKKILKEKRSLSSKDIPADLLEWKSFLNLICNADNSEAEYIIDYDEENTGSMISKNGIVYPEFSIRLKHN